MISEQNSQDFGKLLRMLKVLAILLIIFLAALSVKAIKEVGYVGQGVYPSKTVSVNGVGEVFAAPDVAQFTFSVTEEGSSVSDAQNKVTTKIDEALVSLKDMGIEDKDIKTVSYNAYPRYSYSQVACFSGICPPRERRLDGYEVSQAISVKVRDTEKAGDVLAGVSEVGVSNVTGLNFVVDDQDALIAEAREKAIEDAQEKIDRLAKDLGVKVKGIVGFSESTGDPAYPRYEMMASDAVGFGGGGPVLPEGENMVRVQVYVNYEIR